MKVVCKNIHRWGSEGKGPEKERMWIKPNGEDSPEGSSKEITHDKIKPGVYEVGALTHEGACFSHTKMGRGEEVSADRKRARASEMEWEAEFRWWAVVSGPAVSTRLCLAVHRAAESVTAWPPSRTGADDPTARRGVMTKEGRVGSLATEANEARGGGMGLVTGVGVGALASGAAAGVGALALFCFLAQGVETGAGVMAGAAAGIGGGGGVM
ncbi:hypothetical protein EDB87DRAFT_1574059 [Lactarius vividus]|nr:hypothetical protein EDB87DRAFT_1574059 [Lactarius vividus]